MNDREKLIALLKGNLPYHSNEMAYWSDEHIGALADHLIANGVVVREKGEWESYWDDAYLSESYRCSRCKEDAPTKAGTMHDQLLKPFCPNCGADMRIEEQNRSRSDCDSSGICIECWDEVDLFYGSSPCVDLPVGKERNK